MQEIFKRNAAVIVISVITIVLFFGIVLLGRQQSPSDAPELVEINEQELVTQHSFYKGSENPKATLVEFSDFECPACGAFAGITVKPLDGLG